MLGRRIWRNLVHLYVKIKDIIDEFKHRDKQRTIVVVDDFAELLVGKGPKDHPNNGERFRKEKLLPELKKAERDGHRLVVYLDGAEAYGASFMKEAFAGLIVKDGYSKEQLDRLLVIKATDFYTIYKQGAELFMTEAAKQHSKVQANKA